MNSYVCTIRLHTHSFFPVLNSYVCNIRQIIQKLNNLFQTSCHPSWSTFVRYRTVMYLWTGFSSKTYAEDTIGYIVGTYITSDLGERKSRDENVVGMLVR